MDRPRLFYVPSRSTAKVHERGDDLQSMFSHISETNRTDPHSRGFTQGDKIVIFPGSAILCSGLMWRTHKVEPLCRSLHMGLLLKAWMGPLKDTSQAKALESSLKESTLCMKTGCVQGGWLLDCTSAAYQCRALSLTLAQSPCKNPCVHIVYANPCGPFAAWQMWSAILSRGHLERELTASP